MNQNEKSKSICIIGQGKVKIVSLASNNTSSSTTAVSSSLFRLKVSRNVGLVEIGVHGIIGESCLRASHKHRHSSSNCHELFSVISNENNTILYEMDTTMVKKYIVDNTKGLQHKLTKHFKTNQMFHIELERKKKQKSQRKNKKKKKEFEQHHHQQQHQQQQQQQHTQRKHLDLVKSPILHRSMRQHRSMGVLQRLQQERRSSYTKLRPMSQSRLQAVQSKSTTASMPTTYSDRATVTTIKMFPTVASIPGIDTRRKKAQLELRHVPFMSLVRCSDTNINEQSDCGGDDFKNLLFEEEKKSKKIREKEVKHCLLQMFG